MGRIGRISSLLWIFLGTLLHLSCSSYLSISWFPYGSKPSTKTGRWVDLRCLLVTASFRLTVNKHNRACWACIENCLEQPSSVVPNPQSIDPSVAMLQHFLELCWGQTTFLRFHLPTVMAQNTSYRRKFRSQTSDNMERWKAEQGRGREKRKIRREKIRRERVRRQKIQMREKVGKSRNTVFPMICGSGGSKSRLAKAAGADGHRSDEKLHAVVARSTFWSQNVRNTTCSDHFWKLRY